MKESERQVGSIDEEKRAAVNEKSPARREFIANLSAAALLPFATRENWPSASHAAMDAGAAPAASPVTRGFEFDVTEFGARGDGQTVCTQSIQSAIEACSKNGGGKVVVPPGQYVTGPLFLRSNMQFEVMAGATLEGATDFSLYPTIQGRWEGINRTVFASQITGEEIENVSICGAGTLEGNGQGWWDAHRKTMTMRKDAGLTDREGENPPGSPLKWPRPRMINLYRSKNVRISGLTIQNSPSWNVHPVLCENVWIDGLRILGPANSPNTDGIDPDSCKNMQISNCSINTGDDCIVIKSGYRYQPGNPYPPSENIVITNCVFGAGHGGVVIGSETAGGVRGVTASNCVCDGTRRGLYLKTARGRGNTVQNFRATNFVMRNLLETGIFISMYYDNAERGKSEPVNEFTPVMRDIYISNVTIQGADRGVVVEGLPERPLESIGLSDIRILEANSGVQCSEITGLTLENVVSNPKSGPAVQVSAVRDAEITRVRTEKAYSGLPVIALKSVNGACLQSCSASAGSAALLELRGAENKEIYLALNRPPKDGKELAFSDGATEAAIVRLREG